MKSDIPFPDYRQDFAPGLPAELLPGAYNSRPAIVPHWAQVAAEERKRKMAIEQEAWQKKKSAREQKGTR